MSHVRPTGGKAILDVGTGTGVLWKATTVPEDWQLTLTDLSPGMLETAEANTRDLPNKRTFRGADARDLPFADSTFDVVIASHVLFHVPDIDRALQEARRVLKSGGHFYVSTNGKKHLSELHHFIHDHFVKRLKPDAELPSVFGRFRLEEAVEMVEQYFESGNLYDYPGVYRVSEARPMLDFILSWGDWRDRLEGVDEAAIQQAAREAAETLTRYVKRRPLQITKSIGLIEAC